MEKCYRGESELDPAVFQWVARRRARHIEEGTWASWLYDLPKPHVRKVVACDPRRDVLLQEGNQNDSIGARTLAKLLHNNQLRSSGA